ncbi:MAG: MFS transporter [bacterium]|nr:MFS transporter [bacterium]
MNQSKLMNRNFTMVVIGQIISLFGNTIIRYALPIYLLNQTHSAALFGTVSACSFLPMILLAPVGGIIADRVNKRNIMVVLDFITAVIVAVLLLTIGKLSLIPLLIVTLMLLFGIQGAYQPAVQASIPALEDAVHLNSANAIINMVNSLAGILGPVIGGVIYASFGLRPILYIGVICFLCSSLMEVFIQIPFEKREQEMGILAIAKNDMGDSIHFITHEKPIILKVCILIAVINMVFSALLIVGIPVIITEMLGFEESVGNRLYGYAEGALALGGLIGGLFAGIRGSKLNLQKSWSLILLCSCALPMITLAVTFREIPMLSYGIVVAACCFMMIASTIFSVEMISYAQWVTPAEVLGKVMALLSCLAMCSNPLGQIIYGFLFEKLASHVGSIFLGAFVICIVLTFISKKIIENIEPIS